MAKGKTRGAKPGDLNVFAGRVPADEMNGISGAIQIVKLSV